MTDWRCSFTSSRAPKVRKGSNCPSLKLKCTVHCPQQATSLQNSHGAASLWAWKQNQCQHAMNGLEMWFLCFQGSQRVQGKLLYKLEARMHSASCTTSNKSQKQPWCRKSACTKAKSMLTCHEWLGDMVSRLPRLPKCQGEATVQAWSQNAHYITHNKQQVSETAMMLQVCMHKSKINVDMPWMACRHGFLASKAPQGPKGSDCTSLKLKCTVHYSQQATSVPNSCGAANLHAQKWN